MTQPEQEHLAALDGDVEDLYEDAPCGHLAAGPDRRIISVNKTLAAWLGYPPSTLIGRPFTDLLTAGGRMHFETHFDPLLQMTGELRGITVDLVAADGTRLPMLLTANVKTDTDGRPVLLRIAAQDAHDRRSYERELLNERRRAEEERTRAQRLAKTLQRSLLPPSLYPPEGLDAAAYYHPASDDHVGGDFYDLFPLSHDKWAFFLGDVCGKGADAAGVTSLTRYTLRAAAVIDGDPEAVLHNLDTVLHQEYGGSGTLFCTVIFGVLMADQGGFDVHLASGGHPPALLLSADGRAQEVRTDGGNAVGMLADARFVSTRIRLTAGDTLVLYTDGLTEARIGDGTERYDDHGALLRFAQERAPAAATEFIEAIRMVLQGFGAGLEDDVAVLALGVPRCR